MDLIPIERLEKNEKFEKTRNVESMINLENLFHEEKEKQHITIEFYLSQKKPNKNFTDQHSRASDHCRLIPMMYTMYTDSPAGKW